MANLRRRSSSLFPGLLLLFVGLLLLLHNYRGLDVFTVIGHWWPLILIFWGAGGTEPGAPGACGATGPEMWPSLGATAAAKLIIPMTMRMTG